MTSPPLSYHSIGMDSTIHIVGAGLAGSECAWQLAEMGYQVVLFEMRGPFTTPAHKTEFCGELVCSNSLGSLSEESAPGQLKWEAEKLNSLILKAGMSSKVPAGQALGVDREVFSRQITEALENHPRIEIRRTKVTSLKDIPRPCVVATGPLTGPELSEELKAMMGQDFLYFFDAIAPIIDADSVNTEIAWRADRYDKGTPDYLNCPLNKEEYQRLVSEIEMARKIEPKDFESAEYFEGCMPVEEIVRRGPDTLRFGPMKPVGLTDPRTGHRPYAVVQLRTENKDFTSYNMVGFQTRMAYGEQQRVFRLIPGLENAEFLKLGSIHRNLYINSPAKLNKDLSWPEDPMLFFAGQMAGVEGYFESTCLGLLVSRFVHQKIQSKEFSPPPKTTAMGALVHAITEAERAEHFQPTNINLGLFPPIEVDLNGRKKIPKDIKRKYIFERARRDFIQWLESHQS